MGYRSPLDVAVVTTNGYNYLSHRHIFLNEVVFRSVLLRCTHVNVQIYTRDFRINLCLSFGVNVAVDIPIKLLFLLQYHKFSVLLLLY